MNIDIAKLLNRKLPGVSHCWCNGQLKDSVHPLYGQCQDCGTLVLRQQMTREMLKEFYAFDEYWHNEQVNVSGYPPIEQRAVNDFGDRIPAWYQILQKHKPQIEHLLEIGCAHGGFLNYCRQRGVRNVVGVEPDEKTCEFARKQFNLPHILSGLFPDVCLPFEKFDVVVGFDIIEHFLDPMVAMRSVADLLNDNGICIFQVPCYRGEGREWEQFRPNEHIFLYNSQSIRQLFDHAGLEVTAELAGYFPDDMFVIGRKKPIRSLLFVRTDSIGDSVLSASMLPHIREKYRDAAITVVCQEHIAELYEACPYIDDVVVFNRQRALHDDRYREEIVMQLRALKPDVSLNSVYSREALTDWFALKCGAKRSVALEGNLCNISAEIRDAHNKLYTELLPSSGDYRPELERHKDFLRGLGVEAAGLEPMIWIRPEDEAFAERLFEDSGLDPATTIAMFAGAQHDCRIYETYGAALAEFCKANLMQIIALGAEQDRDINQRNLDAAGVKGVNLSGRTSILRSAAVLKRCRMAVGAETGLAHICCAVGTPNVILLGGGHFGRFMPYSPLTSVACLPLDCFGCNWDCRYKRPYCVKDVAPAVIAEALRQSFENSSRKIRVFMQSCWTWRVSAGRPAWKAHESFLRTDNMEIVSIDRPSNTISSGGGGLHVHLSKAGGSTRTGCQVDFEMPAQPGPIIATSIAPKEIEKQAKAVESWIKLGFRPVSINCAEEAALLRQPFPDVEFVRTKRDARASFGKPFVYLDDFLEYFAKSSCEFCGIVNSDVFLSGNEGVISFVRDQSRGSLVYGSRVEVDSPQVLAGEFFEKGFDFFFFDKSLIPYFPKSEFCLGAPWWDYWMPLIPALEGFQIKKLTSPFAYHIRHSFQWNQEQWRSLAEKCFKYLLDEINKNFYEDPADNAWAHLGQIFSANHNNDVRGDQRDDKMLPGVFSESILEFLEKISLTITYGASGPPAAQHAYDPTAKRIDAFICRAASALTCAGDLPAQCDVSIVLCTKDRAELLDRMLSSLEEAAAGIVYELIVIEGGSSDSTLDVLRRHNVWHVYDESQCLGPGRHSWPKLYNFGFSKALGKWAMYASDDIVFGPDSIARAVEMLDRQKEEVAGGVFFYKNLHPTRQEWAEYGIDFTGGNKLLLNYGLVRLDHFRECGGLEECYSFYCADTDLCYKLYEGGRQLIPLSGCFVTHDNLLDVQKRVNAGRSARDIELCRRRWRHFVPADAPKPTRLLWREDFAEAFNIPSELGKIDCGIESFWRGLACFGQGMFAEAQQQFMQAVQSQCDHRQVLWYLALAADKCQDNAVVEKAATGVVRLAPDFEPALELLLRVTGTEQYSPERALCSVSSGSGGSVYSYADGGGRAESQLDGQGWDGGEPADQISSIATMAKMPKRFGPDRSEMELRREIARFNKVVVWGLKTSEHTHSHIHRHFFETLEKVGARAVFVDDTTDSADVIGRNDLVIAVDAAISHLPIHGEAYYCLHNCPDAIHRRIAPARNIRLQTYMNCAEQAGERWDEVTFFDSATRTLFQPWATDLLAREFKEPILNRSGRIVFWVGSVWDDALGRGNVNEIQILKDILEVRGIRFVHLRGISDSLNIRYVRSSLIAPAIVGRWQMQNSYLPCRMWKNISYGQLGVSNVRKFDDIFEGCAVRGETIEELIDNTLSLPFSTYRDMIYRQQEIVKEGHTYVNRLLNIIKAFESIQNN